MPLSFIFTRHVMLKRGFWLILLISVGSCLDEPDCLQLSNDRVSIAFKKLFDSTADTVSIIGITTPGSDSVFYKQTRTTGIQLLLNPYQSSTVFSMETIFGTYLLDFSYNSTIQYISDECGIRATITDFSVNAHEFDSIKVVNPVLSNPVQLNIEIYRCPRTNQLKLAFRKLVDNLEVADTVQLVNLTSDFPAPFYFPGGKISTLNLPLNPAANSTTFTFEFFEEPESVFHELTVQHARTAWNEFEPCPGLTVFSNLTSSFSTFTQVITLRDSIHDPPLTNFAIFK